MNAVNHTLAVDVRATRFISGLLHSLQIIIIISYKQAPEKYLTGSTSEHLTILPKANRADATVSTSV